MSNNYNLGWFGTWTFHPEHTLNYEVNGFIRHVQNYIRANVSEREGMMQYLNEPAIDIKGVDFDLGYTWRQALQIAVNGSWSDARDLRKYKTDGNLSATYRNRVPNRPWLFGNVELSYTFRNPFETQRPVTRRLLTSMDPLVLPQLGSLWNRRFQSPDSYPTRNRPRSDLLLGKRTIQLQPFGQLRQPLQQAGVRQLYVAKAGPGHLRQISNLY